MDFMIGLPISINWKEDSYNFTLVIVDWLTKMVYYKPVQIIIDAPKLAEVIIDIIMRHHVLLEVIITNQGFLFPSKF